MEPISFFEIVLIGAEGVQNRFARKQEKEKAIDELAGPSEFKRN